MRQVKFDRYPNKLFKGFFCNLVKSFDQKQPKIWYSLCSESTFKNQNEIDQSTVKAIMSQDADSSLTCFAYAKGLKKTHRQLEVLDVFLRQSKQFLSEPSNRGLCSALFTIVAEVNKENKRKQTLLDAARESSKLLEALEVLQDDIPGTKRYSTFLFNIFTKCCL